MATMRALTFSADSGVVFRTDYPKPARKPGEALIRMVRAGICKTDVEITKGYAGFSGVLGHEFLGVVEEIEDGCHVNKGQRVTGDINLSCDHCDVCTSGGTPARNHCPNRTVLGIIQKDGVFADYVTLPVKNLHAVPDHMTDECAVFAEPLGAAFRIVEQGLVDDTKSVAVIGDGKLGLLISEVVFSQKPKEMCTFGRHFEKMNLLPEGINKILSTPEAEKEYENHFDVVVDATGNPNGLKMAIGLTRPLGTVVLKSTCALGADFNTFPIVVKEVTVVGSRCGNFDMALASLSTLKVQPENMITSVYPFDKAADALTHASQKGVLKIQLTF